MLKSPSLNLVGSREFFLSEMEIGAIMSSLAAHMVLPVGDAKPSWDSAARTISISDFGHNLFGTCLPPGQWETAGFFEVGCLLFKVQRPNCISIVSKCFVFLLMNAPLCDWRVLTFHCSALFVLQQKDSEYRDCLYLSLAQWRGAIDRRRSRWGLTELLGRKLSEGDWRGLWLTLKCQQWWGNQWKHPMYYLRHNSRKSF